MLSVMNAIHWHEKNDNSIRSNHIDFGRISIIYGGINK
jgi:hypothetical protein